MAHLLAVVLVTLRALFQTALGVPLHATDINGRIVGGHEITIKKAPWMAALWIPKNDGKTSFCGGSIVHERFILTAAHCFVNSKEPFEPWGIIGAHNLYAKETTRILPKEKHCHENYAADNANFLDDICLLKLPTAIQFSDKIVQITLPEADLALEAGTHLNVSGWGRTEFSVDVVENLRQVLVPLMSAETCMESYPGTNNDDQICAGSLGFDACLGDSGGPLTLGNVQVGVVSYGRGCGTVNGGVYTRVTSYLDWISSTINANLERETSGLVNTMVTSLTYLKPRPIDLSIKDRPSQIAYAGVWQ